MDFEYMMKSTEHVCKISIKSSLLSEEQILIIENWLETDVYDSEYILSEIERALNGDENFVSKCWYGNAFAYEAGKE